MVVLDRECVEFVIARWSKIKFFDFYNLKLKPVMRNLTCGDQQMLLMVIWLVLTRVETEEISYKRLGSCFFWTYFRGWGESVGGRWNWIYIFGGLLLGGSNAEKWGDHQKKKFFINRLKPKFCLWREHEGLLKLHVPLGRGMGRGTNLRQILIHKLQYLIRGIYENRGMYFCH